MMSIFGQRTSSLPQLTEIGKVDKQRKNKLSNSHSERKLKKHAIDYDFFASSDWSISGNVDYDRKTKENTLHPSEINIRSRQYPTCSKSKTFPPAHGFLGLNLHKKRIRFKNRNQCPVVPDLCISISSENGKCFSLDNMLDINGDCHPFFEMNADKKVTSPYLRPLYNPHLLHPEYSQHEQSYETDLQNKMKKSRERRYSDCSLDRMDVANFMFSTESDSGGSEDELNCNFSTHGSLLSLGSNVSTNTMLSNISIRSARSYTKDEYLYANVLGAVINPFGAPDIREGLQPHDLAKHVQQIFQIVDDDHQRWMKEVSHNKPSYCVLNVTVIEAIGLCPTDDSGLCHPYCLLSLASPSSKSRSPKMSPRSSPKSSPLLNKKKIITHNNELFFTRTLRNTLHPEWNESFTLEINDKKTDELELYLWDADDLIKSSGGLPVHQSEKSLTLKNVFRQLKQTVDFGRAGDLFFGQSRIPVRDIPAIGIDSWFDLYTDKKQRTKKGGKCRLRLSISGKQNSDYQPDRAESEQCTIQDFYRIIKQVFRHTVRKLHEEAMDGVSCSSTESSQHHQEANSPVILLDLSKQSRSVIEQFCIQQHFSLLTQLILQLVVCLECSVSSTMNCIVADKLLKKYIVDIEMEWITLQKGNREENMFVEKALLTETELSLFERAATAYVDKTVKGLTDIPKLFPPCELKLDELNNRVNLLVNLLNLHLWAQNESARKDLSFLLAQRLQSDVKQWVQAQLSQVKSSAKEKVIPETKLLVTVLQASHCVLTPIYSVSQYFSRIGIEYFKVAALTMESRLAVRAKQAMLKLDQYQVRYQKFHINIKESSTVSLQLYFALRNLFSLVKADVSERELFRLTLCNYQSWFETAVIFWLQTFRDEGINRMEKALEIEKDIVQVTSLVKYSNSSVDVISCFSKMTTEWRQINFCDADICLLGVTKITDTICDGARQYAEKVEAALEKSCYYDIDDNNHFDVTDQLCISLNNIEHVRQYLHELPRLLNFEVVTQQMSIKHEDNRIGKKALETLLRLQRSADADVSMREEVVLQKIKEKMTVDLHKYTEHFTRKIPDDSSSVDQILHYLDKNLQVLYERLENTIFPKILQQIWIAELQCFLDTLLIGQPPEYYEQMTLNLKSLKTYFYDGSLEEYDLHHPNCDAMQNILDINSRSTDDLILTYLSSLFENITTPDEYHGHLAVRVGYMKETGGHATLHASVLIGQNLRSVSRGGYSEPFVTLNLCPWTVFKKRSLKTSVCHRTVNPNYHTDFQIPGIPLDDLNTKGAVLIFTVWHYDSFLPNDFLGEVVVNLLDIPVLNPIQNINDIPTMLMPIKCPPEPHQDECYQILKERSDWDDKARLFLSRRRVMAGYASAVPICLPMKHVINRMRGKKNTATQNVKLYGSAPNL